VAVGGLQLAAVDHPPAPARLGGEAGARVAVRGLHPPIFAPCAPYHPERGIYPTA
jgi:hypothetical protein